MHAYKPNSWISLRRLNNYCNDKWIVIFNSSIMAVKDFADIYIIPEPEGFRPEGKGK